MVHVRKAHVHMDTEERNRNMNARLLIKLGVAAILLLCLLDMPYGYYELVRVVSAVAFAYFAFDYFKSKKEGLGIAFTALAVLFQPFVKIALGRTLWNVVDVIVAIVLILLAIRSVRTVGKN